MSPNDTIPPNDTTAGNGTDPSSEAPTAVAVKPLDLEKIRKVQSFHFEAISNKSQVAEEYRVLRTNIFSSDLLPADKRSILVTSCHHAEGKTTTCANMALFMARNRARKVLVVDCDLRRPKLKGFFGYQAETDIVDVLTGAEPESAVVYSERDNLHFLPAKREYSNATDYLETIRFDEIVARLHATFDFVLFDTSPVISTADPAVIGPRVGGAILTVKTRVTHREDIDHARLLLERAHTRVLGMVLTYYVYPLPKYLYRYQYYHGYYYYEEETA